MVSAGICFGGKGRLHLIPNKTKVNLETLLPELVQDWLHFATGHRACTHGKAGSRLYCYQLQ